MATSLRLPAPPAGGKLDAFEGVRGLASVAVLFGHLVIAFWPVLYSPGHPLMAIYPKAVRWLAEGPTRVAFDSQYAVALFFILSGFVLSVSTFRNPNPLTLPSAAARRYARLVVPAAVSVAVAYYLLKRGFMSNQRAAVEMEVATGLQHQWLTYFYNFKASSAGAVKDAFWDAFFVGQSRYNPNLWTMAVELAGSFLVYAFVALFGGLRNRWLFYLAVGAVFVLTVRVYMLDFLIGVLLADLYARNERLARPFRLPGVVGLAVVAAAAYAISVKPAGEYKSEYPIVAKPVLKREVYETAAGLALIGATAFCPLLRRLFGCRPLVFLGKLSFGLYLVHLVLICSLGCTVYLKLRAGPGLSHHGAAGWAVTATLAASGVAAWLMYKLVDQPTVSLGGAVFRRWFKPVEPAAPPVAESLPISRAA